MISELKYLVALKSCENVCDINVQFCLCLDAGAEGGEVSSSKALLESQEAEGKRNDS